MDELPPIPPSGFDVRFSSQRSVESVNTANGNIQELEISVQSLQYPITVSWNQSDSDIGLQFTEQGNSEPKPAGKFLLTKNATLVLHATSASSAVLPKEFALHQNYPNPFNPTTSIEFGLPEESNVTLRIFNMLGQEVTTLVKGAFSPGYYRAEWDASTVSSGVYFYRIEATSTQSGKAFTKMNKMVLMK